MSRSFPHSSPLFSTFFIDIFVEVVLTNPNVFERERDKREAKETKIAATFDHQRAQTELKLMRTEEKSKELLKKN